MTSERMTSDRMTSDRADQTTLLAVKTAARGFGYREIIDTLVADIEAGAWAKGDQLPTEMDLVARFGASRNTVREGLRELDGRGYIKRRRGTRSVLIATRPGVAFVNSVRSIDEMLQYARRTVSQVLSVEMIVASGDLADRLRVRPGSRWLRAQILRLSADGKLPIGLSEIYVDERYEAITERLDESMPVYQLIESTFGLAFDRIEQVIEASAASPAAAALLGIPAGSPLLAIRTEFVSDGGDIAEIGFGHFPADRYSMEITLERSGTGTPPPPSE